MEVLEGDKKRVRKNSGKSSKHSCRADGEFEDKKNRTGRAGHQMKDKSKGELVCSMEGGSMNRKKTEIKDFHRQAIDDHLTEQSWRAG